MNTEKQSVKVMLSIIECTDPMDVPKKTYKKMVVKATTDRTGETEYNFFTFLPSVMEILKRHVGKSLECEVFLDEHKILNARDETVLIDRDRTNRLQTVIRAVSDITLSENVEIPKDVLDNHWKLIRMVQKESL